MDEQFITDGLEENRYLKAYQLVTEFESQVNTELEASGRSVRDAHPRLFEGDASLSTRDYTGTTLRTLRTEVEMVEADDEGNNLTINIGLEWVKPANQPDGRANVTQDTMCYILYKIKYGSERVFEAVIEETQSADRWSDIRFGEEKFDRPPKVAPGVVYLPVESGGKIVDGLNILQGHFSDVYAPKIPR